MLWLFTKFLENPGMVGGFSLLLLVAGGVEAEATNTYSSQDGLVETSAMAPLQPQTGWHWQRGGTFSDIEFPTSDTGWFGGDVLIKAVRYWDGAWGWYQQAYAFTDERVIVDLDFFDRDYGWALADDGAIICTANGGVSWQLFSAPIEGMVVSRLDMTGPGRGYATALTNDHPLDREAAVLYSDNCGASWQVLRASGNFVTVLSDIKMFSSQIGVAVGYNHGWGPDTGIYWWTEDGWQTARVHEVSRPLWKASIPTSADFYALGGDYMIYFNRDQWDSEIAIPSDVSASDFYFDSLTNGWLVGSNFQGFLEVLHTSNGGTTWSRQSFDSPTTRLTPRVITGSAEGSLYVGGVSQINTGAFHSTSSGVVVTREDGGELWNRIESLCSIQPEQFSLGTQAGQSSPGMLVGWLGRSKATLKLEAGTWHVPTIIGAPELGVVDTWGGVTMVDGSNAWATSSRDGDSMLMHTTNGGGSWTEPTNSELGGGGPIYAPDVDHIWALFYNKPWDQSATLVVSSNGGGNWYAGAGDLYRPGHLYTMDGVEGWVVNNTTLMHTTDGGGTFQPRWDVCGSGYVSIDWIDGNTGWVLCGDVWDSINEVEYYPVMKTQDGGETWETVSDLSGPAGQFYANLNFQNAQVGYVNHYLGDNVFRLLRTEDGGITWYAVPDGLSYSDYRFLEVGSPGQGWAITKSGTVLYHGPWQSRTVIGVAGGEIASADGGRLTARFPSGSLTTEAEAIMTTYEPSAAGGYLAAHIYELALSPEAAFSRPIELTAEFQAEQTRASSSASTPHLAQWRNDQWVVLPDSQYDASSGLITATANAPGLFAIGEGTMGDCLGDCDGNGGVSVDELVQGVNIALGQTPLDQCDQFDLNKDGTVTVDELVAAVSNALNGCS